MQDRISPDQVNVVLSPYDHFRWDVEMFSITAWW